jgi:hypothetical protein
MLGTYDVKVGYSFFLPNESSKRLTSTPLDAKYLHMELCHILCALTEHHAIKGYWGVEV